MSATYEMRTIPNQCAAVLFFSVAILAAIGTTCAQEPPNVLFIISDDLTATSLGSYNNRVAVTPNLDALAVSGVQMSRAYCQYPVCGPSRVSIMTGLYPRAVGALGNGSSDFRPQYPQLVTLPQRFRQSGYTTARVSKIYHMGVPGDILNGGPGLDDPLSWDMTFNITGPEQNAAGPFEDLSPFPLGPGADFYKVESTEGDLAHADGMAASQAITLLNQFANQPEPFFLAVGMVRPHVPLVAPAVYFNPFPHGGINLPFVPTGDLNDIPTPAQSQANHIKYGMNDEQQRKAVAAYYASVSYMDAQVGRILDELETLNLRDNTIVVFLSDHGYNLGEHTMWQKLSLFEDTLRVPLVVSLPGGLKGAQSNRYVETVDLYPTLVAAAGLNFDGVPHGIHGRSFAELLADPSGPNWTGDAAYSITQNGAESLMTPQWRYNLWQNGNQELYNQLTDPNEYTNLANDPGHASIVAALNQQLLEFRDESLSIPQIKADSGVQHFWNFEGPQPFDDRVGMANGSVTPGTTVSIDAGHNGRAAMRTIAVVGGPDDFVSVDSAFTWNPVGQPFAVSFWFNIADDGTTNPRGVFDFSGNGGTGIQSLYIGSSGQLAFRVDGSSGAALANIAMPEDGQWHFLVANFDPVGDLELHLDGTGVDATAVAAGVGAVIMNSGQWLGAFNFDGASGIKGLNGRLDDLAIYHGTLSEGQITGLFNGTLSPLDIGNVLLGDINCDGIVNLLDVAPFVELLSGGIYSAKGDFNGDGAVSLLDIAPFVAALLGN